MGNVAKFRVANVMTLVAVSSTVLLLIRMGGFYTLVFRALVNEFSLTRRLPREVQQGAGAIVGLSLHDGSHADSSLHTTPRSAPNA